MAAESGTRNRLTENQRCMHRACENSCIHRRINIVLNLYRRALTNISRITHRFREIAPPFHRQGNRIPSAAIRWPDFGPPARRRMSAYGYKRTYRGQLTNVRFTPNSGHSNHDSGQAPANVRFAPNSGRSTGYRRMSAFDPKRTLCSRQIRAVQPLK